TRKSRRRSRLLLREEVERTKSDRVRDSSEPAGTCRVVWRRSSQCSPASREKEPVCQRPDLAVWPGHNPVGLEGEAVMAAKYRKHEAKDYARERLKGVWTALPSNFTADDRLDEKGTAQNLDYCIRELGIEGHYCLGNVAEFWSMTNEERMRVAEINVETA